MFLSFNLRLLRLLEDKILETLSTSAGNILEDEASVNILNSSKVSANEAQEKQKIIEITLKSVETSCSEYLKIAENARILFLCSSKYKYIFTGDDCLVGDLLCRYPRSFHDHIPIM